MHARCSKEAQLCGAWEKRALSCLAKKDVLNQGGVCVDWTGLNKALCCAVALSQVLRAASICPLIRAARTKCSPKADGPLVLLGILKSLI